jgi:hypothetical protein
MAIYIPSCSDINCTAGGPCGAPCQTIYYALNEQHLGSVKFQMDYYINGDCTIDMPVSFEWGSGTFSWEPPRTFPWFSFFGTLDELDGYNIYNLFDIPSAFDFVPYTGVDCLWSGFPGDPYTKVYPYSINIDYNPVEVPDLPATNPCNYTPPDNPE